MNRRTLILLVALLLVFGALGVYFITSDDAETSSIADSPSQQSETPTQQPPAAPIGETPSDKPKPAQSEEATPKEELVLSGPDARKLTFQLNAPPDEEIDSVVQIWRGEEAKVKAWRAACEEVYGESFGPEVEISHLSQSNLQPEEFTLKRAVSGESASISVSARIGEYIAFRFVGVTNEKRASASRIKAEFEPSLAKEHFKLRTPNLYGRLKVKEAQNIALYAYLPTRITGRVSYMGKALPRHSYRIGRIKAGSKEQEVTPFMHYTPKRFGGDSTEWSMSVPAGEKFEIVVARETDGITTPSSERVWDGFSPHTYYSKVIAPLAPGELRENIEIVIQPLPRLRIALPNSDEFRSLPYSLHCQGLEVGGYTRTHRADENLAKTQPMLRHEAGAAPWNEVPFFRLSNRAYKIEDSPFNERLSRAKSAEERLSIRKEFAGLLHRLKEISKANARPKLSYNGRVFSHFDEFKAVLSESAHKREVKVYFFAPGYQMEPVTQEVIFDEQAITSPPVIHLHPKKSTNTKPIRTVEFRFLDATNRHVIPFVQIEATLGDHRGFPKAQLLSRSNHQGVCLYQPSWETNLLAFHAKGYVSGSYRLHAASDKLPEFQQVEILLHPSSVLKLRIELTNFDRRAPRSWRLHISHWPEPVFKGASESRMMSRISESVRTHDFGSVAHGRYAFWVAVDGFAAASFEVLHDKSSPEVHEITLEALSTKRVIFDTSGIPLGSGTYGVFQSSLASDPLRFLNRHSAWPDRQKKSTTIPNYQLLNSAKMKGETKLLLDPKAPTWLLTPMKAVVKVDIQGGRAVPRIGMLGSPKLIFQGIEELRSNAKLGFYLLYHDSEKKSFNYFKKFMLEVDEHGVAQPGLMQPGLWRLVPAYSIATTSGGRRSHNALCEEALDFTLHTGRAQNFHFNLSRAMRDKSQSD